MPITGLKVVRWGNSLAIRLPRDLVEELKLKEADYIDLEVLLAGKSDLDARTAGAHKSG